jgi:hypothetical protein
MQNKIERIEQVACLQMQRYPCLRSHPPNSARNQTPHSNTSPPHRNTPETCNISAESSSHTNPHTHAHTRQFSKAHIQDGPHSCTTQLATHCPVCSRTPPQCPSFTTPTQAAEVSVNTPAVKAAKPAAAYTPHPRQHPFCPPPPATCPHALSTECKHYWCECPSKNSSTSSVATNKHKHAAHSPCAQPASALYALALQHGCGCGCYRCGVQVPARGL